MSEASALGVPAVYVPLEPSSADEQVRNAERVRAAGGAVIVRQALCNGTTMLDAVLPLLREEQRRTAMAAAQRTVATPDASTAIVGLLRTAARRTG